MTTTFIEIISVEDQVIKASLKGNWIIDTIQTIENNKPNILKHFFSFSDTHKILLDLQSVESFDASGIFVLNKILHALEKQGKKIELHGIQDYWVNLFKEVKNYTIPYTLDEPIPVNIISVVRTCIENIGIFVLRQIKDIVVLINIIGASFIGHFSSKEKRIRLVSCVYHVKNLGINSLPLIIMISLTVGAIVAQQGTFLLKRWGIEFWAMSLSSKLILRDTGVLLASIMIAGRSGSAITAELGSMKIREEVDALQGMGIDIFHVFIFPRLLSLVLIFPFITIISDIAGLIGAGLVGHFYAHFSFERILELFHQGVDIKDFCLGLIKSPFMGAAIVIFASIEGLKVKGSAEDLGKKVTASVVKSIFLVILIDGAFTIFFTSIGF